MRAGRGHGALQQLVLVVADGRFHERAALQRAVREVSLPHAPFPPWSAADGSLLLCPAGTLLVLTRVLWAAGVGAAGCADSVHSAG